MDADVSTLDVLPPRLTRDEAVAKVMRARDASACLMCAFAAPDHATQTAYASATLRVVVPRFALRPGHALVVLAQHVTSFAETPRAAWREACDVAYDVARVLEKNMQIARCYVASLGPGEEGVPMSSRHMHLHVVPVDDPAARPHEVLTWRHGVYEESDAALSTRARTLASWLRAQPQ